MKDRKTYAIGVDIGATTIKAGTVDRKGAILHQVSADTRANKGPEAVIRQIVFTIRELFGRQKQTACLGIGIGSPGVVSFEKGTVEHPPNFTGWTEVPLGKALRKVFTIPVLVENDANCAAIAEAKYGAGTKYKDFLFVIWGTGVGGGVIMNRKLYRGPYGGAGEIGHVSIDYQGRSCNCGNKGCIESYIGQRYLSQRTREILQAMPEDAEPSKILKLADGKLQKIEPLLISRAAEEGDRIAIDILEEAGELLGAALAGILNVLDFEVVIIGGGLSASPEFVFDAIERSLSSRVLTPHRAGIRVLRAALGNAAGMIGAAQLVM